MSQFICFGLRFSELSERRCVRMIYATEFYNQDIQKQSQRIWKGEGRYKGK